MSPMDLYRVGIGVDPAASPDIKQKPNRSGTSGAPDEFQELLRAIEPKSIDAKAEAKSPAVDPLKFSQHAEARIRSRAIPWNPALESRIRGGLDTAQAKGSREALILADNIAVIANVKSRTIVTAMDRSQMKEKIFTNIDSAVLV